MAATMRQIRRFLRSASSPPRKLPNHGFRLIDAANKVEEEEFEWYDFLKFYPVRIGEVFRSRYQVIGKLGYGAYSTVWLSRDLTKHKYVTLKVCEQDAIQATTEVNVYKHLNTITSTHYGAKLIRRMLDHFEVTGPQGRHQCLVHEPLGMALYNLRSACPSRKLPEDLLRLTLKHVLLALDFLHTEAGVVHTDLKQSNILLSIEDDSLLTDFERAEINDPSPRKIGSDRVIHTTRELAVPKRHGQPIICDFGLARFGEKDYDDDIQPYVYRAPEVILQVRWDSKVDIWNIGVMAWHLFENQHLFKAKDATGNNSSLNHLAEMIALLGEPPKELLKRSEVAGEYFDEHGRWLNRVNIPNMSLESSEANLEGENKACFLRFIRAMLQWVPEQRKTAGELLNDPWMNG